MEILDRVCSDLEDSAIKRWKPLLNEEMNQYVKNVSAKMYIAKLQDWTFPIVVADANYQDSWVCSPFAQYILLGQDSLHKIAPNFLRPFLSFFIKVAEKFGRLNRMNAVVYVNNTLFSTDLFPSVIEIHSIEKMLETLTNLYPNHMIAVRSLNQKNNSFWIKELKKQGFSLLASRYVYINDGSDETVFKTRIVKSDLKLLKETKYKIEEVIDTKNAKELLGLYHQLYIEEHSTLQPQFTEKYFIHLIETKALRFFVLKENEEIKGMAGFYVFHGVMFCPLFGYEKKEDSNTIYRLLNTRLLLEAKEQKVLFHQSSGASFFKTLRRAKPYLEYTALYTKHLPLRQNIFWRVFSFCINSIGPRFMKKY